MGGVYGGIPRLTVWLGKGIAPNMVSKNKRIQFPLVGYTLIPTKKQNYMLIPKPDHTVFNAFYRCSAGFVSIVHPDSPAIYKTVGYIFPNGQTDEDMFSSGQMIIAESDMHINIKFQINNKLGEPIAQGIDIFSPNGRVYTDMESLYD